MAILQDNAAPVVETVGVFDGYNDLYETVKDLGSHGFGRHQISVRGSESELEKRYGHFGMPVQALEDSAEAPRSPLVGIEELGVAQGVVVGAAIYLGASLSFIHTDGLSLPGSMLSLVSYTLTAAVIGFFLAWVLGVQYRRFFTRQMATGGLVLWVETPDVTTQETAQAILSRHGGHDIHLHDMGFLRAA